MNFRTATTDDAREILTLTHTAFMRYAQAIGQSVRGTTETLDDVIYDIENKTVLLAISEGTIVGAIRCEQLDHIVYASRFCSLPNTKEENVGYRLMDRVKEEFPVDAICLHTCTRLTKLVMFYYRCGYYVHSVSHQRGYPRGLFVCRLTDAELDYDRLTEGR